MKLSRKVVDSHFKTEDLDLCFKKATRTSLQVARGHTTLSVRCFCSPLEPHPTELNSPVPALATRGNELFLVYGVMGGFMQVGSAPACYFFSLTLLNFFRAYSLKDTSKSCSTSFGVSVHNPPSTLLVSVFQRVARTQTSPTLRMPETSIARFTSRMAFLKKLSRNSKVRVK